MADHNLFMRLEAKLDKLDTRLDSVDVTLAAQHVSLKEHIRRTDILEQQVEPIKNHVAMLHGALKLVGIVSIVVGILESVLHILKK